MADTINNPLISWLTNLPPTGAPSRALHLGQMVNVGHGVAPLAIYPARPAR